MSKLNALGDLDDARYNTAPGGACATPHALRVLQAELPNLAAAEEDSRGEAGRAAAVFHVIELVYAHELRVPSLPFEGDLEERKGG